MHRLHGTILFLSDRAIGMGGGILRDVVFTLLLCGHVDFPVSVSCKRPWLDGLDGDLGSDDCSESISSGWPA